MTDHFTKEEKSCPCCGLNLVDRNPRFLQMLNTARELAGIPFPVESMTRCPAHNKEVGGSPTSSHLNGLAADIKCTNNSDREKMLFSFFAAGFLRIGIGKKFIHVDDDKSKPDAIWLY